MKNRPLVSSLIATLLSLLAAVVSVEASTATAKRPQVMILGTFHFQGSTTDAISVTMGDVLTPERQAEIEEIVTRLARFAPTKIMVERVAEREEELNATYRAYRLGEHPLTANETEQIGMRLAKRLGHERLYAVDHEQGMDFQRIVAAAQAAGQADELSWFQTTMAEIQQKFAREQAPERSILEALRFHNGDWALSGDSVYLQLALMGSAANPAGADEVAAWYERNLKIYANIGRQIEGPDERVLAIFGSGHLAHLAPSSTATRPTSGSRRSRCWATRRSRSVEGLSELAF